MRYSILQWLLCIVASSTVLSAQEVIDPATAAKDVDFLFQGEYVGEGLWPGGEKGKIGAQVIAQSDHKFQAVIYQGGLPGAGWQRTDAKLTMQGELTDGVTALSGKELSKGEIADGKLTIFDQADKPVIRLKRTERQSPTLGAEPPEGAVVLFDGANVDNFPGATLTAMKTLQAGCDLKPQRPMTKLHLEFRLSWKPKARGQGRSNSGVYIGGIPEIQVLDSFGLEGKKNECGAFYGRREPNVNMCLPPMQWQTYDVEFNQAGPDQNVLATVRHNGVIVHESYDTGKKDPMVARRLHLQAHGNKVQYRNIWIVEAK